MRKCFPWLLYCLLPAGLSAQSVGDLPSELTLEIDARSVITEAAALTGDHAAGEALVEGLRTGRAIILADREGNEIRLGPPGGPLGYRNVSIALALARAALSVEGIAQPNAQQLAAVLAGGKLVVGPRTVVLDGVLALRARGLNWSEVANHLGLSLADAVSVAAIEDPELRIAIAARRAGRPARIIERSISAPAATPAAHPHGRP